MIAGEYSIVAPTTTLFESNGNTISSNISNKNNDQDNVTTAMTSTSGGLSNKRSPR